MNYFLYLFICFHVDWSQQQSNHVAADQCRGHCDIADDHCCLIDLVCMDNSVYQS